MISELQYPMQHLTFITLLSATKRNIEKKLEVLDSKLEATHRSQIKGESQLSSLNETVEFLSKKFDDLVKEKDEQIKKFNGKKQKIKEKN